MTPEADDFCNFTGKLHKAMQDFNKKIFLFLFLALLAACQPASYQKQRTEQKFVEVNTNLPADPAIEAMILPYKQKIDAEMNRIIGTAARELPKQRNKRELLLGNFVADLTFERAQDFRKDLDLAFVTSGGLRVPIPQGEIKVADIFELMPFENELVVVELEGEALQEFLQYVASRQNISVSNLNMRIEQGQIKEVLIGGKPLEKRPYTLATSDYLANGGDDMGFLLKRKSLLSTEIKVRDMIIEHIEKLSKEGKMVDAQYKQNIIEQ